MLLVWVRTDGRTDGLAGVSVQCKSVGGGCAPDQLSVRVACCRRHDRQALGNEAPVATLQLSQGPLTVCVPGLRSGARNVHGKAAAEAAMRLQRPRGEGAGEISVVKGRGARAFGLNIVRPGWRS